MRFELSRRQVLGYGLAASAAVALEGCGGGAGSSRAAADQLTIGMKNEVTSLSPFSTQAYSWSQMLGLCFYDPLFRKDSSGKLVPALATAVQTPDDNTTILTIRQGVKFHDGSPMTAKDVAYSISARCDPALIKQTSGRPVMSGTQFKSVEVVDAQTVRVNTNERVEFLTEQQPIFVVPADSFGKIDFSKKAVGTGPFKLVSFTSGSRLVAEPNTAYWDATPKLKRLTFSFFNDVAAQATNLRSGELDGVYDVQPLDLSKFRNAGATKTIAAATYADWWIPQMGKAPLDDVRVRKALLYCFDIKQLNAASFGGNGKHSWNPFNLEKGASGPDITGVGYDPDKAKSMLAAAGASGISVPLLGYPGYADATAQGQIIQQGFEAAGIKSEYITPSPNQWLDATYNKGTWEGLAFNSGNLPFPQKNLLNQMVDPAVNLSAYTKGKPPVPAASALYNQVMSTPFDSAEQQTLLGQAQQQIVDDVLVYFMFGGPVSLIVPRGLDGVNTNGFGDVLWNKATISG